MRIYIAGQHPFDADANGFFGAAYSDWSETLPWVDSNDKLRSWEGDENHP